MAVTSRRFGASDEAKFVFVLLCCIVVVSSELLSLLHLLVIEVEAVVRVLDDERVHHGNACRRAKAIALLVTLCTLALLSFRRAKTASFFRRGAKWADRTLLSFAAWAVALGGASRRAAVAVCLLLYCALALFGASVHVVWHLLALHELHGAEVEDQHVVELLSQFEDAAEDVHSAVVCNGCVTASGQGPQVSLLNLNFTPSVS